MPGAALAGSWAKPSTPLDAPASLAVAAAVGSSAPHSLQYASPGTVAAPQLGQTPPAPMGPVELLASNCPRGIAPPTTPPIPSIGPLIVLTGLKLASGVADVP